MINNMSRGKKMLSWYVTIMRPPSILLLCMCSACIIFVFRPKNGCKILNKILVQRRKKRFHCTKKNIGAVTPACHRHFVCCVGSSFRRCILFWYLKITNWIMEPFQALHLSIAIVDGLESHLFSCRGVCAFIIIFARKISRFVFACCFNWSSLLGIIIFFQYSSSPSTQEVPVTSLYIIHCTLLFPFEQSSYQSISESMIWQDWKRNWFTSQSRVILDRRNDGRTIHDLFRAPATKKKIFFFDCHMFADSRADDKTCLWWDLMKNNLGGEKEKEVSQKKKTKTKKQRAKIKTNK